MMPGDFHRSAVDALIARAAELGVDVPPAVSRLGSATVCGGGSSVGAGLWLAAHPDDAETIRGCCYGDVQGPGHCTCWEAVYAEEQAEPVVPLAEPIRVRDARCGDCAYRPDSPERAEDWTAEHLVTLAATGEPFWCHDGMRRPLLWRHPDGREVPGSTDDWRPPTLSGVPFRADGAPALLCSGWAAEGRRQARLAAQET